jgi:uncharacterized membrane protein
MRIAALVVIVLFTAACNHSAGKNGDPADGAGIKDTAPMEKQMPDKPVVPDTLFTGFGNEPFWSVYVVKDNKIVFHPADGTDVQVDYVAPSTANNTTKQYNSVSGNNSIE